jgi:hypothetical protein
MALVETPRRSARLNRKLGKHIRFEELEMLPAKRRKNKIDCSAKNNTPNSSKGKKPKGNSFILNYLFANF